MTRPKVKDADFIGQEAYLKQRAEDPAAVLCTLTVDDHTSADGTKRYMLGGEPVLDRGRRADGGRARPPRRTSRRPARRPRSASTC